MLAELVPERLVALEQLLDEGRHERLLLPEPRADAPRRLPGLAGEGISHRHSRSIRSQAAWFASAASHSSSVGSAFWKATAPRGVHVLRAAPWAAEDRSEEHTSE